MKSWCRTAVAVILLSAPVLAQEDSLATARDLYASAEYEDALLLLNRLRANTRGGEEGRAIEQYRAFCFLALGRSSDAERAIEAVVIAAPTYQPSEEEVSPRVRLAFTDVRRRMLPSIVQQKYDSAKMAFDRKDFGRAEAGFKQVLDVLADPDVGDVAKQPPLSDLKTLAEGFHDLSAAAAAPPPPPPPAPEPPPPAPSLTSAPLAAVPAYYSIEDTKVVPPVTIRQALPPFEFTTPSQPPNGAIEVVINERGQVESAVMIRTIHPRYDLLILDAARHWQYRPATLNGVPVKYRKTVGISVKR
jgi:hypothetical protein